MALMEDIERRVGALFPAEQDAKLAQALSECINDEIFRMIPFVSFDGAVTAVSMVFRKGLAASNQEQLVAKCRKLPELVRNGFRNGVYSEEEKYRAFGEAQKKRRITITATNHEQHVMDRLLVGEMHAVFLTANNAEAVLDGIIEHLSRKPPGRAVG